MAKSTGNRGGGKSGTQNTSKGGSRGSGGWPSKTGKPSGKGRDNAAPKDKSK